MDETTKSFEDCRLYLWVDRDQIGYVQANLEGEDGLARIRTERSEDDRSLVLLMYSKTRETELFDHLRYLRAEGIRWEFIDSPQQEPV